MTESLDASAVDERNQLFLADLTRTFRNAKGRLYFLCGSAKLGQGSLDLIVLNVSSRKVSAAAVTEVWRAVFRHATPCEGLESARPAGGLPYQASPVASLRTKIFAQPSRSSAPVRTSQRTDFKDHARSSTRSAAVVDQHSRMPSGESLTHGGSSLTGLRRLLRGSGAFGKRTCGRGRTTLLTPCLCGRLVNWTPSP